MSQTEREYFRIFLVVVVTVLVVAVVGLARGERQRRSSRYFENAVYYRHNMSPLQIPERRI